MKKIERVLIAHDGSKASDEILADLRQAGLPERLNAVVLAAADVVAPGFVELDMILREPANRAALERAEKTARAVADQVQELFPFWIVSHATSPEPPLSAIVAKAQAMPADLIVVGAHGQSGLSRFIGSVSQMVVMHAGCSVRVVRRNPYRQDNSLRVLVALDGSPESERALEAVYNRNWPVDTSFHVVSIVGLPVVVEAGFAVPPTFSAAVYNSQKEKADICVNKAAARLKERFSKVTCKAEFDAPKAGLLRIAREWKADSVFLGARGMGAARRFLLGSVSMAIAARADSTVEVVR